MTHIIKLKIKIHIPNYMLYDDKTLLWRCATTVFTKNQRLCVKENLPPQFVMLVILHCASISQDKIDGILPTPIVKF